MDRALLKLAQQLNQYDESSLMELWNDYAGKVANFEPSTRWEEYALVFCMIQAVHWKNQLFNSELAASARRSKSPADRRTDKGLKAELASLPKDHLSGHKPKENIEEAESGKKSARSQKACKVLSFRPANPGETR